MTTATATVTKWPRLPIKLWRDGRRWEVVSPLGVNGMSEWVGGECSEDDAHDFGVYWLVEAMWVTAPPPAWAALKNA